MIMTDPIRLRDPRSGADEALRELIDAGRSETPGSERLRGVAGRLGLLASSVPGAAGSVAKGGAAGLGHAGVAKLGAVVLILGAGTTALALRDRAAPVADTVTANSAVASEIGTALVPLAHPPVDVPDPVAPMMSAPASTSSPQPSARGRSRHLASPSSMAPATASSQVTSTSSAVPATLGAPATWGSSVALAPQVPSDSGPSGLVEDAKRALATDPSRALALALLHEQSRGGRVEERDLIIIEALVRLGRTEEARPRASRFLRVFPASPHRDEVAAPFGFDPGLQNP
jgi:hypothetical protein